MAALSHLSASHLIISTETNLPYKKPRENISLLKQISPGLLGETCASEAVPSLQNILVVDNSDGRVEGSSLVGATAFSSLLSAYSSSDSRTEAPISEKLYPDDVINIQFTSGTTSMPKAACLTHKGILNNGFFIGERMGLTERDVVCCPPPLFHCFGCVLGYMATATHGEFAYTGFIHPPGI